MIPVFRCVYLVLWPTGLCTNGLGARGVVKWTSELSGRFGASRDTRRAYPAPG